jgi:hypothetical protein
MSDAAASDTVLTDSATASTDASAATTADTTTATAAPDTLLTGDDAKPAPTDDATKTEEPTKEGEEGKEDAKKEEQKGAPEEYEAFKLPETFKVDEPVMGEFKTLAKELGLSQEAAQKLVDMQAKLQGNNATAFTQSLQAHVDKTATEWAATAKADPEYGGAKFSENVAVAKQALDAFGTPELKALLNESRLGSNPELIRFMFRAGKAISQDGFVSGRAASAAKDTASALYGSTK